MCCVSLTATRWTRTRVGFIRARSPGHLPTRKWGPLQRFCWLRQLPFTWRMHQKPFRNQADSFTTERVPEPRRFLSLSDPGSRWLCRWRRGPGKGMHLLCVAGRSDSEQQYIGKRKELEPRSGALVAEKRDRREAWYPVLYFI